jgi:hypothetical protein
MTCKKCDGTGWYAPMYQRGTPHATKCDACCKHEGEPWLLSEYHMDSGKWCCRAGCGQVWDTLEEAKAARRD